MIYTLRKINKVFALILLAVLLMPLPSDAQERLSFSVSPTIFDMTANPGQSWRSTVRIINANPYDLTVYVDVVNFVPKGEGGVPRFIPKGEGDELSTSLANWITSEPSMTIPAEKTVEFPFTIALPDNASPGGHFAALMISTKPNAPTEGASNVQTAQVITSLVFLRVSGDITESSSIRSFRSTRYLLSKPEATFELRIENKGNVHIQPQGEITIFNMWGQERGTIPVNQQMLFGNVLPNSVRKYSFTWTGEWSPTDIGRYTAVATLGYGLDEKQFMHADTAFWIIPWKFLLLIFGTIGGFIALMSWAIKLYVRRMLTLAGVQTAPAPVTTTVQAPVSIPLSKGRKTKKQQLATVVAPIEVGILDLRTRLERTHTLKAALVAIVAFIKQYWRFFVALAAIVLFVALIVWFVKGASAPEREFEVIIEGENQSMKVSSGSSEASEMQPAPADVDQTFVLSIINRSGDPSLSDKVATTLSESGYSTATVSNDDGASEERTVIVYDPKEAEAALRLSKILDNALLSSFAEPNATTSQIVIYLGSETIAKIE